MVRLQAPIVRELGATLTDTKGLRYLAAGRRAATLRRRLGDWLRLARWLAAQGAEAGYPDLGTFIIYLEARL